MKTSYLIFALYLTLRVSACAQGTITPPVFNPLVMNFVTVSNSPAEYLPSGDGSYNAASGAIFSLNITAIVPTNADPFSVSMDARILEMSVNGGLTPIIFPGGNPAFNVSSVTIGSPSSCIFSTSSVQLTPGLVQELLNGQLFVESDFTYGEYLGQVSPVPEPSSFTLICFVIGFFALSNLFHRAKIRCLTIRRSRRRLGFQFRICG